MAIAHHPPSRGRKRKVVFYSIIVLFALFVLRTPTSNFWHPLDDKPPLQYQPSPDSKAANPDRDKFPRGRLTDAFKQYLNWTPPTDVGGHYPPYDAYENRDYDPNRWEAFPQYVNP